MFLLGSIRNALITISSPNDDNRVLYVLSRKTLLNTEYIMFLSNLSKAKQSIVHRGLGKGLQPLVKAIHTKIRTIYFSHDFIILQKYYMLNLTNHLESFGIVITEKYQEHLYFRI